MKVVFLEDVQNVAAAGETKEVADGYGRNYLIPKKLAVIAAPGVAEKVAAHIKSKMPSPEELAKMSGHLDEVEVVLKAKAGSQGRLHGAITNADIAEELEKSIGLTVDKRKIELEAPIHNIGEYEVVVKLAKDITPKLKVVVVSEVEVTEEVVAEEAADEEVVTEEVMTEEVMTEEVMTEEVMTEEVMTEEVITEEETEESA